MTARDDSHANDNRRAAICGSLAVDEIEAGETGNTLRLWQAREALRQAELRLTAQAGSLQAFEARTTAMLGWIAVAISTLAGAAIVSLDAGRSWRAGALCVAFIPALVAAINASRVLWPKQWNVAGYAPETVMDSCVSELQQIEYLVSGYAIGIDNNDAFLDRAGGRIRHTWWALLATPMIAGGAVALILVLGA